MSNVMHIFQQGGLVMYPLLVCSVIAVAILINRVQMYKKAKSNIEALSDVIPTLAQKQAWSEIVDVCRTDGGIAAGVIAQAAAQASSTERQEKALEGAAISAAGRIREYLNYLETIVTLSPLLGLLGTVTGMIGSFSVLSVSEGQPFAITGGVGEALIATATGLLVAILALVIHSYLVHREDSLISGMEELSSVYLTALAGERNAD